MTGADDQSIVQFHRMLLDLVDQDRGVDGLSPSATRVLRHLGYGHARDELQTLLNLSEEEVAQAIAELCARHFITRSPIEELTAEVIAAEKRNRCRKLSL